MTGSIVLMIFLFALGLTLVIAEVLFPSFGMLSVLATICFVAAAVVAFRESMVLGVGLVVVCVILVPMTVYFGFKHILPKSFVGRHIIHSDLVSTDGHAAGTDLELRDLLGAEGTARSYLRPAGVADIGNKRVNVVTEGQMVARGTRVKVVHVEGNRVVVRPVDGLTPYREASETG